MPELPEVETVKTALSELLPGKSFLRVELRRKNLRYPLNGLEGKSFIGKKIIQIRRRGRYLIIEFENLEALLVHLGMTGRFLAVDANVPPQKHQHVIFYLSDSPLTLRYDDVRRFGFMSLERLDSPGGEPECLADLGLEPFSPEFNVSYLNKVFKDKKQVVKSALMDNHLIAGIGNIYASEILFAAGINPTRSAGSLTSSELQKLVETTLGVLREAIDSGVESLKNKTILPDGTETKFNYGRRVYGKAGDPCVKCGKILLKTTIAGRSTFYCANCQGQVK
jgi:formamidopyrimidine-DNA glycosylase